MTFARESAETLLFQVTGFLLSAATGLIVMRILGPTEYGQMAVVLFYLAFFSMLGNFTVALGIIHHTGKRNYRIEEFAGNALLFGIVSGIIIYAVFFSTLHLFSAGLYKNIASALLIVAMLQVPFNILTNLFAAILQGNMRIRSYNVSTQFPAVFTFILVVVVVLFSRLTLMNVLICMVIVGIAGSLYAMRNVSKLTCEKWKINMPLLKSLVRDGFKIHIGAIATFLYGQINILMINKYLDLAQVGYYSLALNLANILLFISIAIDAGLYPRVAAANLTDSVDMATSACKQVLLLTIAAAIVMGLSSRHLIKLLAGERFLPSVTPLIILMPGLAIFTISKTLSTLWVKKGWFLQLTFIACFTALVNFVFNVVLIPKYGISGAALANSLTYVFNSAISVFLYYRYVDRNFLRLFAYNETDFLVYRNIMQSMLKSLILLGLRLLRLVFGNAILEMNFRIFSQLTSACEVLRLMGARVGDKTNIPSDICVYNLNTGDCRHLNIGSHVYIGPRCVFDLTSQITIEDYCSISAQTTFITHLDVGNGPLKQIAPRQEGVITIKRGAWIGVNSTMLHNVTIGEEAMIGAMSLVNKDIPSRTIAFGIPCKVQRKLDKSEIS